MGLQSKAFRILQFPSWNMERVEASRNIEDEENQPSNHGRHSVLVSRAASHGNWVRIRSEKDHSFLSSKSLPKGTKMPGGCTALQNLGSRGFFGRQSSACHFARGYDTYSDSLKLAFPILSRLAHVLIKA